MNWRLNMARKRMLDPSIWADEDFNNLSSEARLLFIGIISNADDDGRLPGNALYLSANIFPYSGMSKDRATKIRDEILGRMRSLVLYEIEGREYLQLLKWRDYQSINKATPSKYPPLPDDYRSTTVALPPNRIEENRIEKKRKEVKHLPIKDELTLEDKEKIAGEYSVKVDDVKDLWLDLFNYSHSKGVEYANYYMTLQVWTRKAIKEGKISVIKNTQEDEYVRQLNQISSRN